MVLTSLPYRIALFNALSQNVLYQGQKIGVFLDYVAETTTDKVAILSLGNTKIEAYIILLNQTSNEAQSNKCNRTNNDSIQIQINTIWPASKGGSKIAEEIANIVLGLLFGDSVKNTNLTIPNMDIWKSELVSSRNMNYDTASNRAWVCQLVLESYISQY